MDARERRRQRAEENKPGFNAGDFLKKFRVPIVIVLLAIGGSALAWNTAGEGATECPGHWHPVLEVYVDGQKLRFADPSFQAQGDGKAAGFHVHDASGVLHFHPATPRCIPLDAAMEHLAMEKSGNTFVVGPEYGPYQGEYINNETHSLRIFVNAWGSEDWDQKSSTYLGKQPGNGDRILIVYGNETTEEIEALQASVAQVPENYTPQGVDDTAKTQKKFVSIMAILMFAGLALWLWYNFAKKTW